MFTFLVSLAMFITFVLANYNKSSCFDLSNNVLVSTDESRRVYFGEDVVIEDYPYFASLQGCGAVILSEIWIATVAHCVDNARIRGFQEVYVGGATITESLVHAYNEYIIHPDYQTVNELPINDLALLKLDTPLELSERIQPAQLPTSPPPSNVVHVARGRDETGNKSINLKKVDRILLDSTECLSILLLYFGADSFGPPLSDLQRMFLCSKRFDDIPSVCRSDSGSPLFSGNILIALHSIGNKDCEEVGISLDVNILNYVPWIKNITGL